MNYKNLQFIVFFLLIAVNNLFAQIPTMQDCMGAIPICNDTYHEENAYSGEGNYTGEINGNISCLGGELNDVWYVFTVQTNGNLNFSIVPNDPSDDYDWAVYDLSDRQCSNIFNMASIEVSCNYAPNVGNGGITGPNGNSDGQCEPVVAVQAGQTFVINVSQFSPSNAGYTINFEESTANIYDDNVPVMNGVNSAEYCGSSIITCHFSENILCASVTANDFEITGPGGPYTIEMISSPTCEVGAEYGMLYELHISPVIETGTYTLYLNPHSAESVVDNCGNPAEQGDLNFVTEENLILTIEHTNYTCYNTDDGTITVEVDNENGIVYYSIDGGETWIDNDGIFTNLLEGTYLITAKDDYNCQLANVEITIENQPEIIPNAGNDDKICDITQYQLSAEEPSHGTGNWTCTNEFVTFDNAFIYNATASNLPTGQLETDITFIWTVSQGVCLNVDTVVIKRYETVPAVAGNDNEICELNQFQLSANEPASGYNGSWTTQVGIFFDDLSSTNTTAFNLPTGDYLTEIIFEWTVNNGTCISTDELILKRYETIPADAGEDNEICDLIQYQLSGNNPEPGYGVWTTETENITYNNASMHNATAMNLPDEMLIKNIVFTWSITNGNCAADFDEITLTKYKTVIANAGEEDQICDTTQYQLLGNNPFSSSGIWTTDTEQIIFSNISQYNATISNIPEEEPIDNFTFTWTITNGICISYDDMILTRYETVTANVSEDDQICDITDYQFLANDPSPGNGYWTSSQNDITFNDASSFYPIASNIPEGNTVFTWTVQNGVCDIYSDSLIITRYITIVADAGSTDEIFDVTDYNLIANNPEQGTGLWSASQDEVTFDDISSANTWAHNIPEGITSFTWTITNGICVSSDIILLGSFVIFDAVVSYVECNYVTVDDIENFEVNDRALLIQMNGADINLENNSEYGIITNYNDAGNYEFLDITGISGNNIYFNKEIKNNYTIENAVQLIKVYKFDDVEFSDFDIACPPWDGSNGGVLVIDAAGTITLNADIKADGKGFRGGELNNNNSSNNNFTNYFTSLVSEDAGRKGEGISYNFEGTLYECGSGANANGGGGGNSLNNGGGGGGNVSPGGNGDVSDDNTTQVAAAKGKMLNYNNIDNKIFLGGGGGAGHSGSNSGSKGGNGGGIIIIRANEIIGNGHYVRANGNSASDSENNGAGGGGAGGTILLEVNTITNLNISAAGGNGGSVTTGNGGAGGGASGGIIWYSNEEITNVNLNAGLSGTDNGSLMLAENGTDGIQIGELLIPQSINPVVIITKQPNDTTFCEGYNAGFNIEATCQDSLRWQVKETAFFNNIADDEIYSGATTINLNLISPTLDMSGFQYRCIAYNVGKNDTSDVVIINIDKFIYANAGEDDEICDTTNYQLSGNEPEQGDGIWTTINEEIIFDNTNLHDATISNFTIGNHINNINFIWTITNGTCTHTDDMNLIRYETIYANVGEDDEICDINEFQLIGNDPLSGSGVWTSNNQEIIFENRSVYNTNILNIPVNEIIFTWTITNGVCPSDADEMILKRYETITADTEDDAEICDIDEFYLSANNPIPATGVWTTESSGITFTNQSNYNTEVHGLPVGETIFSWTITNEICGQNSDELKILRYVTVIADAGDDMEFCNITELQQNGNEPESNYGTWTSESDVIIINNESLYNTDISTVPFGETKFTWTINSGACGISSDDIVVINYETVTADAGENAEICELTEYQLSGNLPQHGGDGIWTCTVDEIIFDNETVFNTTLGNLPYGTTTLTWTLTNGICTPSSDEINITRYELVMADAGEDIEFCQASVCQLQANNPAPGNGTWTSVDEEVIFDNQSIFNTNISNIQYGTTTFVWTVNNVGCGSYSDSLIILNYELIDADAGEDVLFCDSVIYQLSANHVNPGYGTWTAVPSSILIENRTLNNTVVENIPEGKSIFTWTVINGLCISSDDFSIDKYITILADAGEDNFVCDTSKHMLTGNEPLPGYGVWTSSEQSIIFDNSNSVNAVASNIPEGDIIFTWTITNGICGSNSKEKQLKVSRKPVVNIGDNIEICRGEDYTFSVSEGYDTYLWQDNSNLETFTANTEGLYSVTVTDICGTASDNAYIILKELPIASAGKDTIVCQGDTVTLFATGGTDYTWSGGVEQAEPFIAQSTRIYTVTVVSEENCTDDDNVRVLVNQKPKIKNINTIPGHQITVTAESEATPLLYSLNSNPYQNENYFSFLKTGNYYIFVKDTNNCVIKTNVIEIEALSIPTVFTPNGDGINDTWKIGGVKKFPDAEVNIFNRWGKLIANYKAVENNWDGTYKGIPVKADTYWFVVSIDNYKLYKGSITIKK